VLDPIPLLHNAAPVGHQTSEGPRLLAAVEVGPKRLGGQAHRVGIGGGPLRYGGLRRAPTQPLRVGGGGENNPEQEHEKESHREEAVVLYDLRSTTKVVLSEKANGTLRDRIARRAVHCDGQYQPLNDATVPLSFECAPLRRRVH
jgi:hypothetical protein